MLGEGVESPVGRNADGVGPLALLFAIGTDFDLGEAFYVVVLSEHDFIEVGFSYREP